MRTREDGETKAEKSAKLVDLQGRRPEDIRREETRSVLRSYLDWSRYWGILSARLRALTEFLRLFGRAKFFATVAGIIFLMSILLAGLGQPGPALFLAMMGFGLSLVALLYGALPQVSSRLEGLPWHASLAAWALLSTFLAFVGFSSSLVILVVLFIGGFTAVNVLWSLLPKILSVGELFGKRKASGGVTQAAADPNPFLFTMAGISAWSLTASLLMGLFHVHHSGPFGAAFLFANVGVILGLIPLESQLLRGLRKPTLARWYLFRPRRLVRDVLFATVVAGLVGYEVSIAMEGSAFSGIPAFALGLVLLSYLGVLFRRLPFVGERLKPHHPLVLPAFGMLLLFAPLVVLLSNQPSAVTRLYGAAQTTGLLGGVAYVVGLASWRERAHRLSASIEETIKKKVHLDVSDHEAPDPYHRIRSRLFRPRGEGVRTREAGDRRRGDNGSHG